MAGYYGKIPGKGDFVSKGIPREIIDKLHSFFAQGMRDASDSIGETWLEHYAIAPMWYFYMQPGVLSHDAWIGLWMPSVDRVNRHFPFTVMQALDSPIHTISDLGQYQNSLFEMEDLLLSMLEPDADIDALLEAISQLILFSNPNSDTGIDPFLNPLHQTLESKPNANTDFEIHLLDKVSSLEKQVERLSHQLEQLLLTERTIEMPAPDEPATIELERNLVARYKSLEKLDLNSEKETRSIWISAGNDQMKAQVVAYDGIPIDIHFKQFLVGL